MNEAFGADGSGKAGSQGAGTQGAGKPISFGEHFAASDQFNAIFREGMGLVERTASYLDGAGRKDAKALRGAVAMAYTTESMRLTTRLLELASWLLVRRALKDGEITAEEARIKRRRLNLDTIGRPSHVKMFEELPEGLRQLILASFALRDRIVQLDRAIEGRAQILAASAPSNPVEAHLARIEAAFSRPTP